MSEELIAPSEQGTPVTEYKTFKNLPNPVQVRLQEYNSFVGKTVRRLLVGTSELNFFNTSNPSAELSLAGVLKYVRNHSFLIADGFTETHP